MDLAAVLREVDAWPIEERLDLVEAVWQKIVDAGGEVPLTENQKLELDRRLAALEAAPEDVVPWEAVKEHLRRPR
jgi:putative addiction module component (TIGR02574 family)